jgi:hypothetical protein
MIYTAYNVVYSILGVSMHASHFPDALVNHDWLLGSIWDSIEKTSAFNDLKNTLLRPQPLLVQHRQWQRHSLGCTGHRPSVPWLLLLLKVSPRRWTTPAQRAEGSGRAGVRAGAQGGRWRAGCS